jgi:tetratricopeptide (TPR) repeat protein
VLLFLRWGEKYEVDELRGEKLNPEDVFMVKPLTERRFKAWGLVFIWFSLFHTVPWVLINAHHSRSADRYVLIQENDPHPVDESKYNLYKIARILEWAGLLEEEKKMYQRAIEKNPYDTLSYYNLAVEYYEKQDFDQAILILDKLLKVAPLHPKANGMIAELYGRRKEYSKALPHLERALPYFADNADYLYQLAVTYSKTNQMKKAGVCALEVIKLRPDYVRAYQFLGSVYASLGDFESAREVWKHILTIDPGDSIAIRNLKEVEKFMKK